mgnify:CR=1 FL=1
MQAIELETDITPEGYIYLPKPLQKIYGRHARLILLLDEASSARQKNDLGKLLALRSALQDDEDFDEAMQDMEKAWQQWQP